MGHHRGLVAAATAGLAIMVGALSYDVIQVRQIERDLQREVARAEVIARGSVGQTIVGCQRGNVLRLALADLQRASGRRVTVVPIDCRQSVIDIHRVDPGPIRNLPRSEAEP